MSDTETKMRRNIRLFGIYKIFTKRMFLPLTTIYASQAAGLSIAQIGITSATATIISVFFEASTGYWADQHGRANSAKIGASLAAAGTLLYVITPSFWGIMGASIVLAIGYSFLAGAMEALIHDSLVVLGEEKQYARIASRAQSLSLVANAVFIALVPLLYPIDKRLPFVVGFLAYLVLFWVASLLTEPTIKHTETQVSFFRAVQKLINKKTALFFVALGFAYAMVNGMVDLLNLGMLQLGLQPQFSGIVFGTASIVGAGLGLVVHHLKRLSFRQYATLDVSITMFLFVCYGLIQSLPLALASFILSMSMWRYQKIMYQHYVLELYGTTRYKATLLSLFSNFGLVHEAWLGLTFTKIANHVGILPAISYGIPLLLIFLPVLLFSISQFSTYIRASRAEVTQ